MKTKPSLEEREREQKLLRDLEKCLEKLGCYDPDQQIEVEQTVQERRKHLENHEVFKKMKEREEIFKSIGNSSKIILQVWYESLDGKPNYPEDTGKKGMVSFRRERIDSGRKSIERIKNNLESIGVAIGSIDSLDKIELLDFLYQLKKEQEKRTSYKAFFQNPSLENIEYLPNEYNVNGELLGVINLYLINKCSPEFVYSLDNTLYNLELINSYLETNLINNINWRYCSVKRLEHTKSEVSKALKGTVKELYKSQREETIFEKTYFVFDLYNLKSEAKDMMDICEETRLFIDKVNFQEESISQYISLAYDVDFSIDDVVSYARKNKEKLRELIGINSIAYNKIVETVLPNYLRIIDKEISHVSGLDVLIMIQEAGINLPKEKGCEISSKNKFYRYKTKDAKKTLNASLVDGTDIKHKIQGILIKRVEALHYVYLGMKEEYILVLDILICMYKNNLKICECKDVCRIMDYCEVLEHRYAEIEEYIFNS